MSLERRSTLAASIDPPTPFPLDLLREPLLPHQAEAAQFLCLRDRALLADEMGLGKTIEALAACEYRLRQNPGERVLIVPPKPLLGTWCAAIERFTGRRANTTPTRGKSAYTVLHPQAVMKHRAALRRLGFTILVVDEAHLLKNPETQRARAVTGLMIPVRFLLTGTPVTNDVVDLVGIFALLDPEVFPSRKHFEARHLLAEGGKRGAKNLMALSQQVAPYILRRERSVLGQALPGRQDHRIEVPMTEAQRCEHHALRQQLMKLMGSGRPQRGADLALMHGLMQSARRSAHGLAKTKSVSNKIDKVIEIVRRHPNEKVVVFMEWHDLQGQTAECLTRHGVGCVAVNGKLSTPAIGQRLADFKTNPNTRVLLCTQVGNTGLNLQHATVVINMTVPWTPAQLNQQVGRVHRYGQLKTVQVYTLVAADSFEEAMLRTVDYKTAVSRAIFAGDVDEVIKSDRVQALADEVGQSKNPILQMPLATSPALPLLRACADVIPKLLQMAIECPSRPISEALADLEAAMWKQILPNAPRHSIEAIPRVGA